MNIFEGKTKKGKDIIVRQPQNGDAELMTKYINNLSNEKTFVSFQGEQMSLEEEQKFLDSLLLKIPEEKVIYLFAFLEDELVGICGIEMKIRAESHVGILGISVAKAYRGDGIGKILMDLIIKEAQKVPQLKIITLSVYQPNELAKSMYEDFGFKEFGNLPDGIHYKDKYVDEIMMYKKLS